MAEIVDLDENRPHRAAECICVKCYWRGMMVWPADLPMHKLECRCGSVGTTIVTGDPLIKELLHAQEMEARTDAEGTEGSGGGSNVQPLYPAKPSSCTPCKLVEGEEDGPTGKTPA